jgi:chemotaxis protein CheD
LSYRKEAVKGVEVIKVGVGDFKLGRKGQVLETVLGCCVGICLYDEKRKIGGLLHTMLPTAPRGKNVDPVRYFNTGLIEILRAMQTEYGINETDLTARLYGGAKLILQSNQNIGQENVDQARRFLKQRNIKIISQKVGGNRGYMIQFYISTGSVKYRMLGKNASV